MCVLCSIRLCCAFAVRHTSLKMAADTKSASIRGRSRVEMLRNEATTTLSQSLQGLPRKSRLTSTEHAASDKTEQRDQVGSFTAKDV